MWVCIHSSWFMVYLHGMVLMFCSIIFVSAVKEAYAKQMAQWQLQCIDDFIVVNNKQHNKLLVHQQDLIHFLQEHKKNLIDRSTNYAGGAVVGVAKAAKKLCNVPYY